ncbi:MAG: hypothetical protein JXA20_05815, partial [Spirochaetes bacterium]|nr:hypothetical protein [Spirochaetota bacterium]
MPGAYFITVNVKDRVRLFGEVRDGTMVLNADGVVAHTFWESIPDHFPGCSIDEFVVMPDHVHGIVIIDEYTADSRRDFRREFRRGRIYATPTETAPTETAPTETAP